MKAWSLLLVGALVSAAFLSGAARAENRTVYLQALNSTWQPGTTITVNVGDVVTFHVWNNDTNPAMDHSFLISGTTVDAPLLPGMNTTQTVTFNTPGTYHIYCGVLGHASGDDGHGGKSTGMVVTLVVQQPGTTKTPGPEVLLVALAVLGSVAVLRLSRRKA
ncbi:MAG TPA: cupredoxin domain-containing protein [Thermoplasmata archaeon]|nr:cupredoxin domain-containing protein [Thermoplasmata archaeon]